MFNLSIFETTFLKHRSLLIESLGGSSPFAVFVIVRVETGYAATTRATDKGEQGRIGLPGGKVDSGENPIDAAIRESREEGWGVVGINSNPVHQQLVDGKMVWWYTAKNAVMLNEYKEKGRITPIVASKEEVQRSGYGNENLSL